MTMSVAKYRAELDATYNGYKSNRERIPETISGRYSFMTFEEYVGEKWEMSYRRTVELIESANAAEKLRNSASFPTRESHVRPLLKLTSDEERAAVWQTVVDRGETVTAKLVEAEVEEDESA